MERTVDVVPEAGLHARPASKFVQTVNQYDATVTVGRADDGEDGMVDASSMLAVTGLNVEHGESVRIVAEGEDASDALDALETVLTTPVDEGGEAS
ncbi:MULTISPECIES: phosphocarrier protein HPr [Haloarcula]|uniref:Phosphotransferase n=1 Tax=Haloarcula pellucida TaxID=1427151 RepID=A0A830GMX9_9EURY|nr:MULTISPECIES: phosphocarrier protein HPr [Halomicroarcula]MBX0348048.1 HPr family phosphocarrier protein [Halomicroarcula pellucida]MDS0277893.1 HPr family phosphocarrier protein [Halomicroarcula sp. S1AR25-4]GGN96647.1 phosphotransferase [Halomicroarcula pellucida]